MRPKMPWRSQAPGAVKKMRMQPVARHRQTKTRTSHTADRAWKLLHYYLKDTLPTTLIS